MSFEPARNFILREGRLLERRLFAALFEGGPPGAVVDVLRGYQNDDGGFGHALEPDKRVPDSLAIDVEVALASMVTAGAHDPAMVERACDFLEAASDPRGAVPLSTPVIERYPRAEHYTDWTYEPALNPTAGLAGWLHRMGVSHPWLERATAWCWSELEAGSLDDAHAVSEVMIFLAAVPDQERARSFWPMIAEQLPKAMQYRGDPGDPEYGVNPLHYAPTPDSPWRPLFTDDQIEGWLDRLVRDQQPDGGWPITWEPPSVTSTLEWRGIETVRALRVLRAYGRLE